MRFSRLPGFQLNEIILYVYLTDFISIVIIIIIIIIIF